jgi:glyoxylase-like metal-dependent hydrolase (beta-lactamase superfamily II)
MKVKVLSVGMYQTNCYICAYDDNSAVIIDPGDEGERIYDVVVQDKLAITHIILTHGHPDHVGAVPYLKKFTGAKVLIHKDDCFMINDNGTSSIAYLLGMNPISIVPDGFLADNDTIDIGLSKAHIMHTPGHTPGSICIQVKDCLFTGDTLFAGSIGRTDLPGGDQHKMRISLNRILTNIDDNTILYPGHGPSSTMKYERISNPFLADVDL